MEKVVNNFYLSPSMDDGFKIAVTTGKELISDQADNVCYIDPNFKKFGLNKKSKPTKEIKSVSPLKLKEKGTFRQIFGEISIPLEKLFFTMSQIAEIVKEKKENLFGNSTDFYLTRKHKNFLLTIFIFIFNLFFKDEKKDYYEYFVVDISVQRSGMDVGVDRFEDCGVLCPKYNPRVIVP